MDLLCSRYASPFYFVDNCILAGNFLESINYLLKQNNEDKYWEMYLATLVFNDKSYQEWRKEGENAKDNSSNITKDEANKIAENSQDILSGFKPPQEKKGG